MMSEIKNPSDHPLHPVLASRWSPYAFDPNRAINQADLLGVLEAARWAMSSNNSQPWRYIVGRKGHKDGIWQKIYDVLVAGNQAWTKNAPVLIISAVKHHFEYNGKLHTGAMYDVGAASASLTFEATSRGLVVHQMGGFIAEKATADFEFGEDVTPVAVLALGYLGSTEHIEEGFAARDLRKRERKTLSDIVLEGGLD